MTLFALDLPLHRDDADAKFTQTHLGQAHIAGTGPKGKTCRDCRYFGKRQRGHRLIECPGFYAATNLLKQGRCYNPIPGKSSRAFPHSAASCSLFEQSDDPWPLSDPEAKK